MNVGYASTWNVGNSPNGELFQLSGVQVMHDAQVAEICKRLPQIIRCERPLIFNILCLFGKPLNNCRIVHRHLFALHTWLLPAPSWRKHSPSSISLLWKRIVFSVMGALADSSLVFCVFPCGWSACDLCVPLCVVRLCSVLDGLLVMSAPVAGPRSTEDNDVTTAFHSPTTLISSRLVACHIIMICLSKLAFWSTLFHV